MSYTAIIPLQLANISRVGQDERVSTQVKVELKRGEEGLGGGYFPLPEDVTAMSMNVAIEMTAGPGGTTIVAVAADADQVDVGPKFSEYITIPQPSREVVGVGE